MRKWKKRIIEGTIILLAVGLLGYRFWPRSMERLLPAPREEANQVSCYLDVGQYEEGLPSSRRRYEIKTEDRTEIQELLNILDSTSYQASFRNLLPWERGSLHSGRDYDGRLLSLTVSFAGDSQAYSHWLFLGSNTMSADSRQIYPVHKEIFGQLADYIHTHGTMLPHAGSALVKSLSDGITWGMQIWAMCPG